MASVVPIHLARPELPTAHLAAGQVPLDTMGRPLRDLRISVTDRCNFRCTYCMPKSAFNRGFKFMPHEALLSFEEIERLARLFVARGVRKIRLTGGEPLLRRGIENLVEKLAALPGVEVTLTTNGSRLAEKARALKAAGLQRVTVSLDALDEATFRRMAGVDVPVRQVLAGIDAAAEAGLAPVKINMVVKRGLNDHSILPMVRRFRHSGHILRFIEFMDAGTANGWRLDDVLTSREVIARIHAEFPVEPVNPEHFSDVAKRWRYVDGAGEIGVISSVSQAFCATCTRVRISPEGKLYTCLFAQQGFDLRQLLRGDGQDERLDAVLAGIWRQRADHYSEIRTAETAQGRRIEMYYIGG